MAANKAVVVNASGAIVAPVSAATFRNNNGLQIGLNIQAWSANLDSAATHISWSGSNATFASEVVATSSITTTTGNLIVTVGDVITGGGVFATGNISGAQLRLANAGTGAFNASIVHNGTMTAAKTLTLNVSDGNRTLQMGGDLFLGANFTTTNQGSLTLTVTGATNVTLPTSGTVYATGGTDVSIGDGGTGASTAAGARTNLGFGTIVKTSDTAKTSDTSPAADPALQFAVAANTNYRFKAWVLITVAANGPHIKGGFSGPSSPTSLYFSTRIWGTTSALSAWNGAFSGYSTTHGTASQLTDNTATYLWELEGTLRNGANAGTFSFDWSQWTSSGSATTVKAGSYIQWEVCS